MNEQEEWWKGEAGDAYTERNRVNWWGRVPFWAKVMGETRPTSVMELGCNSGWNLMAIRALGYEGLMLGLEINEKAAAQALAWKLDVRPNLPALTNWRYGLVFTAGVLIHVAPTRIRQTMRDLIERSERYVLAVEYEADQEEEIEYRGERGKLWKRPFGKMYEEAGLKLIETWPAEGFDRCTAWLLEKV